MSIAMPIGCCRGVKRSPEVDANPCDFRQERSKKASHSVKHRLPSTFPEMVGAPRWRKRGRRLACGILESFKFISGIAARSVAKSMISVLLFESHSGFEGVARALSETFMTSYAASRSSWLRGLFLLLLVSLTFSFSRAFAADEPDLIFRRSTVFKLMSPNDKLATYGIDDPEVEGVACHFTIPEKGGFTGWLGLAEQVSDISLACRQIGPIRFKRKLEQADDMFRQRRSMFFKKMQIVRGCDAKRNVLVYMVYSDKLIEGSPKNSTSSVPIMPWGAADGDVQKCGDFIQ
jgi:CreA protein